MNYAASHLRSFLHCSYHRVFKESWLPNCWNLGIG